MTCTCRNGGGYAHHHSFGGTYPCEAPERCRGCRAVVEPIVFTEPAWPDDQLPETD